MSNTLWLINPHKRGTTGRAAKMANAKKPRTAAQKAATAALVALNKKRRAAASKTAKVYAKNPVKPLKSRTYSKAAPKKVYKRNPISSNASVQRGKGMFVENIKPAAIGAGAALAFDIVWGRMTFIPESLRSGNLKYPVKLLGALALGVAAEKVLPKQYQQHATTLVRGPLTVIMHDAAKEFMQSKYPSLALAAYEEEQMAEIMHDMQVNGYDEPSYAFEQPQIEQVSENLELQGLGMLNVPQYDGVAY